VSCTSNTAVCADLDDGIEADTGICEDCAADMQSASPSSVRWRTDQKATISADCVARALADLRSQLHADECETAVDHFEKAVANYGLDVLLEGSE